jgi:pimeloyl-ACP methyl ester carboxylesterase
MTYSFENRPRKHEEGQVKEGNTLGIIASAYRALHESEGFDALLAQCEARLAHGAASAGVDPFAMGSEGGQVLDEFRAVLEKAPDPVEVSGIFNAIADAPGPAIVLTPDLRVIASNEAGQERYGAKLGARPDFDWLDDVGLAALHGAARLVKRGELPTRKVMRTFHSPRAGLAELSGVTGERISGPLIAVRELGFDWTASVDVALASMFELTPSECDICRLTFELADLSCVAQSRGTSIRTVRTQLSQVFLKTGCKGQPELVRFLASVCASHAARGANRLHRHPGAGPARWRDPLGRERIFEGPYGEIAYSWMGREGGRPGIVVHAPFTGYVLAPEIQDMLDQAGIQLFAPSRPGFGNSAPASCEDAPTAGSRTIEALMDHLGLQSAPLIGLVNGFIPALRFAKDCPDRVEGILNLGACLPLDTPEHRSHLPLAQRVLLSLAQQSPAACDWLVRLGLRNVLMRGPEFLLARMYASSQIDTHTAFDPEVLSILMASTSLMSAQDHRAILKDLSMIICDFGDWFDEPGPPIAMVAGTSDPVFQIERARMLERNKDRVRLIEVAGAGQTVAFACPHEALAAIRELFETCARNY